MGVPLQLTGVADEGIGTMIATAADPACGRPASADGPLPCAERGAGAKAPKTPNAGPWPALHGLANPAPAPSIDRGPPTPEAT